MPRRLHVAGQCVTILTDSLFLETDTEPEFTVSEAAPESQIDVEDLETEHYTIVVTVETQRKDKYSFM